MTNVEHFEKKAKSVFASLKENFDSIGAGDNFYYDEEPVPEQPVEEIETDVVQEQPIIVPVEKAPRFRIYWRAWKEGNNTSGQTESNLETAQMARAESMTKLYDLGFNDIEILAIETIKSDESESETI